VVNLKYTDEEIEYVYYKNDGYCRWCDKKLALINYGRPGEKGAWEIDHSNPVSRGRTNYLRNLVPACISCNRSKGKRRWR